MSYLFEIIIILVLIILNGIFAISEFALVSAKKTRLRQRAEEGDTRAATALKLANEPTPFLSTIQIGITLVGILAGAFGGATIAEELAAYFTKFPTLASIQRGAQYHSCSTFDHLPYLNIWRTCSKEACTQ